MQDNSPNPAVVIPDQKNYDVSYGLAVKLAGEKLRSFENLEYQCRKSASVCLTNGSKRLIQVKYLNRTYQVSWPEIEITLENSQTPVELRDKILILDYLTHADGAPLAGEPITFQELGGVANYYPTFFGRAVKPLISGFGASPERLLEAAVKFGGIKSGFGDIAVTIPAFTRVLITVVIWKGDDEFPANANILFDKSVTNYLSAEAIIVLCQTISWSLVKGQ